VRSSCVDLNHIRYCRGLGRIEETEHSFSVLGPRGKQDSLDRPKKTLSSRPVRTEFRRAWGSAISKLERFQRQLFTANIVNMSKPKVRNHATRVKVTQFFPYSGYRCRDDPALEEVSSSISVFFLSPDVTL